VRRNPNPGRNIAAAAKGPPEVRPTRSAWVLAGTVLAVAYAVGPATLYPFVDVKAAALGAGAALALLLALGEPAGGAGDRGVPLPTLLFLAFSAWQVASLLWAGTPSIGLRDACFWISIGAVALAAGTVACRAPEGRRVLRTGIVLATLPNAWIVLAQAAPALAAGSWPSPASLTGALGYHNVVAFSLLLGLPFVFHAAPGRTGAAKLLAATCAGSVIAAILLCQSRTAYMGLVFEGAALSAAVWKGGARRMFVVPALLSLLLVGAALGVSLAAARGEGGIASRTREDLSARVSGRKLTWMVAADMARAHPLLGTGAGGFAFHYIDHEGRVLSRVPLERFLPVRELTFFAHDEFLQALCEGGPVGILLLAAGVLLTLWMLGRRACGPPQDGEALAAFISMAGFLPPILLDFPLRVPPTALFLPILAAFAGGDAPAPCPRALRWIRPLWGLLALAAALGLASDSLSSRTLKSALGEDQMGGPTAGALYDRGIALALRKGEGLSMKGSYILRVGDPAAGEALLLRSLGTFRDPLTYENLGRLYLSQRRFDEAVSMFRFSRSAGIHYFQDTCDMAKTLAASGRVQEALGTLREILRLFPKNPALRRTAAEILLQQRDFAGALEELSHFPSKYTPDDLATLGVAQLALGRTVEAERNLRLCLDRDPANVRARNNLGALLFGAGRRGEAMACFEETLRLDPANAIAQKNLAALRESGRR
jgi:tetratricopeptide (TPR) repeat protein/O-antigen ligase